MKIFFDDTDGGKWYRQELEKGEPNYYPKGEDHSTSGDCPHCGCLDASGEPKNLYLSEAIANDYRRHCESKHQISLEVYSCKHGMGWHLTHRRQQPKQSMNATFRDQLDNLF